MSKTAEDRLKDFKPQYTATLLAMSAPLFSQEQLESAIQLIDPELQITRVADTSPYKSEISAMMSILIIDGCAIGYSLRNTPAHESVYNVGRMDNLFVQNPKEKFKDHTDHMTVFAPYSATNLEEKIRTAQLITIVSAAIMRLSRVIAIKWEDAMNFMTSEIFWDSCSALIGKDKLAIPLWIRLSTTRGLLDGAPVQLLCTYGLPLFGSRDVEFYLKKENTHQAAEAAFIISSQLLRRKISMSDGDSATFNGVTYDVKLEDAGRLSGWPTADLLER